MSTEIVSVNALSKSFGPIKAINNISFTVNKGEVVGILGPNGSGKTTTLAIMLGVKHATNGSYSWFGEKGTADTNKRIGALLEVPHFYPYLSLERNLKTTALARGKGLTDIDRVLQRVGLYERRKTSFQTLSLGMKQRLAIAATMLGDPEVLVLDEPANGLDPEGIAEIRELILDEAKRGKTIIMASHILDEVEKVCSHVVILKNGKCLASGRVGALLTETPKVLVEAPEIESLINFFESNEGYTIAERTGNQLIVGIKDGSNSAALNRRLFESGITLSRLEPKRKTLEEQFLELVKKG